MARARPVRLWSSATVILLACASAVLTRADYASDTEAGQRQTSNMYGWSGWYTARATNYGAPGDPWNINMGSCEYYNLWGDHATGWDIAALSDKDSNYWGSCGRCFEVKCAPQWVTDGYGESMDRTGICYDTSASVVVQITDSCLCDYSPNSYSNRRWCCGDMPHFDLSVWTFQKLADLKWGVLSIYARQVPCGYQVNKRAYNPYAPVYPEGYNWIPSNWQDRRPWPEGTPSTAY